MLISIKTQERDPSSLLQGSREERKREMERTFPTTLTHTKSGQERVMERILVSPLMQSENMIKKMDLIIDVYIYIYTHVRKKREEEFFFPCLNHEVVKEIGSSITYQNGEDESYKCTSKPGTKSF